MPVPVGISESAGSDSESLHRKPFAVDSLTVLLVVPSLRDSSPSRAGDSESPCHTLRPALQDSEFKFPCQWIRVRLESLLENLRGNLRKTFGISSCLLSESDSETLDRRRGCCGSLLKLNLA